MNDELRSEVLRRRYGGQSGRDIARELHLSRKTVAKVLVEHRQQRAEGTTGLPQPRQGRGSVVDAYESTLRDFLARYPDMTVVRLLEEVRARGYQGGYTVLRQRIKQLRKQGHRSPVERFETGPGVQAQMDWATYTIDFSQEGRRKVNLFSYVLGYSRRQYLHFTASQDLETTLREHVRAFEHLQGCAATCLYDNMKVVVARYSAKSIERILAVQARPKTCWDRMAEEEPSHLGELLSDDPTPPRPATEYQHLLFEESNHDDQTEEKDDAHPEDQDEPF